MIRVIRNKADGGSIQYEVDTEHELQMVQRVLAEDVRRLAFIERGREGGRARAARLSPERRREIAKQAALTRWRKGS